MTTRRKLLGWLLIGLAGGLFGQGCGSSSTRSPRKNTAVAGSGGKDMGTMTVEPPGGQGGNGGISPYDVLCGIPDGDFCVPDERVNDVCKASVGGNAAELPSAGRGAAGQGSGATGAQGGELSAGAGAGAGDSAQAGQVGALGGQGGEPSIVAGGAGAAGENGGAVSGGEGGQPVAPPSQGGLGAQGGTAGTSPGPNGAAGVTVSTLSPTSCQVTADPKHKDRPIALCLPAGTGDKSDPCFSGADCQPGLACVGQGPGQCRPYCCSGASSCSERTHCSVEPLLNGSGTTRLEVPVCMPVVDCGLAEPYPCGAGATCSCPAESACVVVGSDGTTSCVAATDLPPAGEGQEGMDCPCAWGFVCSQANKQCVKLCQVAARELYCGGARCQPSTALPDGWGTCVGEAPKGSN